MSIEIGKKYINKYGEVVEVSNIVHTPCVKGSAIYIDTVVYHRQLEDFRATERVDFLEQYKPYEVVYEYQYAYLDGDESAETTVDFYKDDAELLSATLIKVYQRLDFTKRERK